MNSRTDALHAVSRASARSASVVHAEMKRGLNSLASIAATAPFIGLFGTVLGIFNSFRGLGTEKSTIMPWMARFLSEAMVPTALGVLVAVLAFCFYKYLLARLDNFDVEMKSASLELVDELARP